LPVCGKHPFTMAIKYTGDVARFTSSDLKQENSASQQERRKKERSLNIFCVILKYWPRLEERNVQLSKTAVNNGEKTSIMCRVPALPLHRGPRKFGRL